MQRTQSRGADERLTGVGAPHDGDLHVAATALVETGGDAEIDGVLPVVPPFDVYADR